MAQELARQYASGDLHPPMLLRGRRHTLSLPVDVSAHRRKCGQVGGGPTRLGHVHQSCRRGPPPSRHATSPDAAGRCRRRRGWYGRRCLWPRRGVGSTATGSTPAAGQRTPAAGRPSSSVNRFYLAPSSVRVRHQLFLTYCLLTRIFQPMTIYGALVAVW